MEEPFAPERARNERLAREVAANAEMRQQFLPKRGKTIQTAYCQLAEDKKFFQELQFNIRTAAAELKKLRKRAIKTAEEPKIAQADEVLQSAFPEATREATDTQTTGMTKLQ